MNSDKKLLEMLIEAGYPEDDIFHHNSDLYVFVSELTTNVIKEWCKINGYKFDEIRKDSFLLSTFNDQITGKQMYDIAFQYYER